MKRGAGNNKALLLLLTILFSCSNVALQAGLLSRIKKLFKTSLFSDKNKVKPEDKPSQQEKPKEENAQQPKPRQHIPLKPTTINIDDVIHTVQSVAVEGPEIYSVLINDSIGRLLEKTEKYLEQLTWGSRQDLVEELTQRAIYQKGKASMLLQMQIWRQYMDSPIPLKNFIQDITREQEKLIEYQTAIGQLINNEWLKSNEAINKKIVHLLKTIEETRKTLDTLDSLTVELLEIRTQAFEPQIYRALFANGSENGRKITDGQIRQVVANYFTQKDAEQQAHNPVPPAA